MKKVNIITEKNAFDALSTLRMKANSIDLVLTEVHMAGMNGFELQKQIHEEFQLPVVFMSADDKDVIAVKCLQNGAAHFIAKPTTRSNMNNLWQFVVATRKGKTVTEESRSAPEAHQIAKAENQAIRVQETNQVHQEMEHASSSTEYMRSMKEPRFRWTDEPRRQFLEAVKALGGPEKATTKKIFKRMNVPGLTLDKVANYLQKYRHSLKQVSASNTQARPISQRRETKKTNQSTFARMQPVPSRIRQMQSQNLEQDNMIASLQPTYSEGNVPAEANRLGPTNEIQHESISHVSTMSGNLDDGHLSQGVSSSTGVQTTINFPSLPPLPDVDFGTTTFDQQCGEVGSEFVQSAHGEAHSLSDEHFLPSNQSPRQIN